MKTVTLCQFKKGCLLPIIVQTPAANKILILLNFHERVCVCVWIWVKYFCDLSWPIYLVFFLPYWWTLLMWFSSVENMEQIIRINGGTGVAHISFMYFKPFNPIS